MQWEPVVEMTQVKGDSETDPLLSPEDTLTLKPMVFIFSSEINHKPKPGDYVRSSLITVWPLSNNQV